MRPRSPRHSTWSSHRTSARRPGLRPEGPGPSRVRSPRPSTPASSTSASPSQPPMQRDTAQRDPAQTTNTCGASDRASSRRSSPHRRLPGRRVRRAASQTANHPQRVALHRTIAISVPVGLITAIGASAAAFSTTRGLPCLTCRSPLSSTSRRIIDPKAVSSGFIAARARPFAASSSRPRRKTSPSSASRTWKIPSRRSVTQRRQVRRCPTRAPEIAPERAHVEPLAAVDPQIDCARADVEHLDRETRHLALGAPRRPRRDARARGAGRRRA